MVLRALNVDDIDVSTPSGRSGMLLGMMSYFFIFALLMGGMYLAIDSTAGERERGSLEPLLALPVTRDQLMLGKISAACIFMALSLALSLVAFSVAIRFMPLESLGPEKVRAFAYNTINKVSRNCLTVCAFVAWSDADRMEMIRAGTGWQVNGYEYFKLGERALTLARIYNLREGFTPADDRLALRSYGPTTSGALAEGGIDPEELEEAVHTYYGMMGWDTETGVPTVEKLQELDIGWAAKYLPK